MLSKFLRSSTAFLYPRNIPSDSVLTLLVNEQIQAELEQAAEQGMVSLRSQDDTPTSGASQPSRPLYPQVIVRERKRKTGNEAGETPTQTVTKRRRRSAKSNGDATPSSAIGKRGRPSASAKSANSNATDTVIHNEEPSMQSRRSTSPRAPETTTDRTFDVGPEDKAVQESGDEALDASKQVKLGDEDATESRRGRKPKKRVKRPEEVVHMDENTAGGSSFGDQQEVPSGTITKANHKRFGSEDIEIPETLGSSGLGERNENQNSFSEEDGESGDEAPEIVAASAGFDKARTSALEAAKVAARQKAEQKIKRREHEQRLKLQAKSAKNSRPNDKPPSQTTKGPLAETSEADSKNPVDGPEFMDESPKIMKGEGPKWPAKSRLKYSGKGPLPLLLPDEILAAKPVNRVPKPAFSNSKVTASQKRKFLDFESKPPKDIKRGNVTISVLQDKLSMLPPKSSQASKDLREAWLIGRRGFKGAIRVPRQKPSKSFVRRK